MEACDTKQTASEEPGAGMNSSLTHEIVLEFFLAEVRRVLQPNREMSQIQAVDTANGIPTGKADDGQKQEAVSRYFQAQLTMLFGPAARMLEQAVARAEERAKTLARDQKEVGIGW